MIAPVRCFDCRYKDFPQRTSLKKKIYVAPTTLLEKSQLQVANVRVEDKYYRQGRAGAGLSHEEHVVSAACPVYADLQFAHGRCQTELKVPGRGHGAIYWQKRCFKSIPHGSDAPISPLWLEPGSWFSHVRVINVAAENLADFVEIDNRLQNLSRAMSLETRLWDVPEVP